MFMKVIKGVFRITLILLLLSINSCSFREHFVNMIYEIRYSDEIKFVKKYILLISEEKVNLIKKISSEDAYFLKTPFYLKGWAKLLRKTDIDSLKALAVEKKVEHDEDILFITVYFENDRSLNIGLKLKYAINNWIVKSVTFPDVWAGKT